MIGGDFPWRDMTKPEVRVLVLNGLSTHEVATVAGCSDDAARWLIAEALKVPREALPTTYPQEAAA